MSTAASASSSDLTLKIAPFLDKHLVLPLIEFQESRQIYAKKDLLTSKHSLLSGTKMVDFSNAIYQELHGVKKNEPGFEKRRGEVVAKLTDMQKQVAPILEIIQDPTVVQQLKQDKVANMMFLSDKHKFKPEMLDVLYKFALMQYDVGNYTGASETLYHFRVLSTNAERNMAALWGKLAADIMAKNWDGAHEELNRLREVIDQGDFSATSNNHAQLQQRTWLLHWSLFVFFNHPSGKDGLIDLFLQPHYLNAIQTSAPWLLRYLAAAIVVSKRRRSHLKEVVRIIRQEAHVYADPATDFLVALYVNFDFDGAQQKLRECESVFENDFFLAAVLADFRENARQFVFEMYCRIHQCIDIQALSSKLNMDKDEGEKWIVNLIRDARMQAKIDSETNTVVMGVQYQSVYQQVMERTKALSFRSSLLASNIEKRETELNNRRKGHGGSGRKAKHGNKQQQQQQQQQQHQEV
nr:Eukaryotic translation initiation factor 3 subunit E [Polyrhizophydium stewartii]